MSRPNRYFLPGYVWHITHRCHNRDFFLDYAKYRKLWMKWLYEGTGRYDVPIFYPVKCRKATLLKQDFTRVNFTVTSNHVHLLVLANDDMEAIPLMMQLVAGQVAQIYNRNRHRKGAFREL